MPETRFSPLPSPPVVSALSKLFTASRQRAFLRLEGSMMDGARPAGIEPATPGLEERFPRKTHSRLSAARRRRREIQRLAAATVAGLITHDEALEALPLRAQARALRSTARAHVLLGGAL